MFTRDGRNVGVEIKRTDAPRLAPSMRNAVVDLGLDRLFVVYPGRERYAMSETIEALPVNELALLAGPLPTNGARDR
jgi:uncharacterized protein